MSFNADITLGALLVGTWANSILYTIEIIQAAYYYRHFKHDNWMLKLLVSSAIVIDSVSMIANYASVYLYTITYWGDLAYLQNQYWPYPLYLFSTGVVAALAQSFLVVRYWRLTKNHFITLTLFLFITVAIGGAFTSALTIAIFPGYKDRGKVVIPGTTWLVAEAVTDISIALALLLQLRKVRSSFKETRSLVNRLVTQTVQTGTAGATIALAVLVSFLANNQSNVPTGIAYCLGRIYCITMLANLNRRKTESTWSSKGTSSGANPETRGERGNQERSEGGDEYGGIRVHRTAVVHIDTPQEFSRGSFKTNPGQGLPNDSPAVEIEMTVNDSASYTSKKKRDLFAP
ncbi:hypothetical protein MVEN_01425800 [Mycena venus]|uniref:DUF6534 domain-containing protein n=1 Tax=Mycena venus TaxID=2733690 RepID=A0A8H6XZB9_9AGAR|nr:hypothetical protein MVEN_01425800 [Mycena venus]